MRNIIKRSSYGLTAMLMALCFQAEVGQAQTNFVYNFNSTFSGTAPQGPAPWLTATFQNDGSLGVFLTIYGSDLAGSEKLTDIYFNLNTSLNATNLTFALQSSSAGLDAPTTILGNNGEKADGDGFYDFEFKFSTSGGIFTNGDSITYLISGITNLTVSDFEYTSLPSGNSQSFYGAAHIQGIGANSGWVEPDSGPIPVPEPSSVALMTVALGFLGIHLRHRNKRFGRK